MTNPPGHYNDKETNWACDGHGMSGTYEEALEWIGRLKGSKVVGAK